MAEERFARLMAMGQCYNYRLWIRGPLLRIVGGVTIARTFTKAIVTFPSMDRQFVVTADILHG